MAAGSWAWYSARTLPRTLPAGDRVEDVEDQIDDLGMVHRVGDAEVIDAGQLARLGLEAGRTESLSDSVHIRIVRSGVEPQGRSSVVGL